MCIRAELGSPFSSFLTQMLAGRCPVAACIFHLTSSLSRDTPGSVARGSGDAWSGGLGLAPLGILARSSRHLGQAVWTAGLRLWALGGRAVGATQGRAFPPGWVCFPLEGCCPVALAEVVWIEPWSGPPAVYPDAAAIGPGGHVHLLLLPWCESHVGGAGGGAFSYFLQRFSFLFRKVRCPFLLCFA